MHCISAFFAQQVEKDLQASLDVGDVQEMIGACLTSDKFSGSVDFTGQESSKKGKIMSNCQTREALDWQPKYFSFEDFMASGANDFYNTSPLYSAKPAA